MNGGDWGGALKGFRGSAFLNGRNAPCHGNMGLCLAHLGRKAEVLAELDLALEIDPDYLPAGSNCKMLERMVEGRPLENTTYESVNYAKDRFIEERK